MSDHILNLFSLYSYWIIFFGILLDNAGLPIPGELFLLLAGAFAGAGGMDLSTSILVAIAGAVTGDSLAYFIGRLGGRRLIDLYINCTLCTCNCADRAEAFFKRFGYITIPMARFVVGVRTLSSPLAGALRIGYIRFLTLDFIGSAAWTIIFIFLGYIFRDSILDLIPLLERVKNGFFIFFLFLIAIFITIKLIRRRVIGRPDFQKLIQSLRFKKWKN